MASRLKKEQAKFNKNWKNKFTELPAFVRFKSQEDPLNWDVEIKAPEDSLYAGSVFKLLFQFPPEYPFKHPEVKFATPIIHPNVATDGSLCADMVKSVYDGPTRYMDVVFKMLYSIMKSPNKDSFINAEAAELLESDPAAYEEKIKNHCKANAPTDFSIESSYQH